MPMRVVVMGVSGCGKSSLAEALAQRWSLPLLEGDRFHSSASVAKMAAGVPLTDDDRWPWLDRVGRGMAAAHDCVASCSALRKVYRDRLRAAAGPSLRFCLIEVPRDVLVERMTLRVGHYMPVSLLDSQLSTLERPGADEPDVLVLDGRYPLPQLVEDVSAWMAAQ